MSINGVQLWGAATKEVPTINYGTRTTDKELVSQSLLISSSAIGTLITMATHHLVISDLLAGGVNLPSNSMKVTSLNVELALTRTTTE